MRLEEAWNLYLREMYLRRNLAPQMNERMAFEFAWRKCSDAFNELLVGVKEHEEEGEEKERSPREDP